MEKKIIFFTLIGLTFGFSHDNRETNTIKEGLVCQVLIGMKTVHTKFT